MIFLLIVLLLFTLYSWGGQTASTPEELTYSQFVGKVEAGLVSEVTIQGDDNVYNHRGDV